MVQLLGVVVEAVAVAVAVAVVVVVVVVVVAVDVEVLDGLRCRRAGPGRRRRRHRRHRRRGFGESDAGAETEAAQTGAALTQQTRLGQLWRPKRPKKKNAAIQQMLNNSSIRFHLFTFGFSLLGGLGVHRRCFFAGFLPCFFVLKPSRRPWLSLPLVGSQRM